MSIVAALLIFAFVVALVARPRIGFRLQPSGSQTGCGEMTVMVSYDRLRWGRTAVGTRRLSRLRRNILLAGYGWNDPLP